MSDNPLKQTFGGTISSRKELEEMWGDVDAFAGTLVEEYDGEIEVQFIVNPVVEDQ